VQSLFLRPTPEFLEVAIETFDFGKKPHIEGVPIEHANRIVRIRRRDEPVAGRSNGFKVARRHKPGHAGNREVLHCAVSARIVLTISAPAALCATSGRGKRPRES
jgi:hypothetical protein